MLNAGKPLEWNFLNREIERRVPYKRIGRIISGKGGLYEVRLPSAVIGSEVEFITERNNRSLGEVVSLKDSESILVMPYEELQDINSKTEVSLKEKISTLKVSENILGRILDAHGRPLDDKGPLLGPFREMPLMGKITNPLDRPPIDSILDTGVSSINAFMSIGKGQRMAIMAGPGVGKSVLLGMIARNTKVDVNVIALVGERGREVLEFVKNDLGEEGLKKSVIVVATSDSSALLRMKAAYTACTIAEYFRDKNNDVLFMMDSVSRFAFAHREIALATGEPPGQKGYAPSIFHKLPTILERAGTKKGAGSITGIYTVLVEGGDFDEPISDAIRAISDGHLILSRELAAKNHYPAIDILNSISRLMFKVVSKEHRIIANYLRELYAAYKESEDLINVGAYVKGTNIKVDKALLIRDELEQFLKQEVEESITNEVVYDRMVEIARLAEKINE